MKAVMVIHRLLLAQVEKNYAKRIILKNSQRKLARTHITQISPVDVQKMSISDIGPILWMSVGEPRNIPTAETEIHGMSFF